ncbi:arsenic resistance protein [Halomonas korlensis]|uniref:Arsenite efflux pump ArsB, ACR3 family n=1 Tax=Halomonas korlensis TaxID=463301 RepID=A0A1I7FYU2_9GAMM|nr:arsenic resistance protein [Halomonas korlensis]SFU41349.1 Arsenite efflux pump ArsB, ACR3 family [Halomonas korlensis]
MRDRLEQYQGVCYLTVIFAGLMAGAYLPGIAERLAPWLWPLLGVLLYVTFTQLPLTRLRARLVSPRFLVAAVLGNFVIIPLIVWGLVQTLPDNPGLRLGVMMVLLLPCTDWFISFTHLGRGDAALAVAFTPLSLLLQIVLLPAYLVTFLGHEALVGLFRRELLLAFGGLILLPLTAALITGIWVRRAPRRNALIARLGDLPIPLLALVLFVVAAGQVNEVAGSLGLLVWLLPVFVAFLVAAVLLSWLMAWGFRLSVVQGRVLAFSFGSRNSFVVLPLALALPAGLEVAVMVVVFQSLVELFGMLIFLWLVPNRLFPDKAE